ncbi:MAG: RrF2 family transcriptional regulator [Armatimonadota bacterium]
MKISAKEEYGLRCMLQLASRGGASHVVTVREIAEHEGLSTAYVGKLLWILSRAGLTESVRGVEGGYRLSRPPEEISLGDIVRALSDSPDQSRFCFDPAGASVSCVHTANCTLQPLWGRIMRSVQQVLDETPLAELIQQNRSAKSTASAC